MSAGLRTRAAAGVVERLFPAPGGKWSVGGEIARGVTIFAAMSYIVFVQSAVLSQAGMEFQAVMLATCLAAAAATFLMG